MVTPIRVLLAITLMTIQENVSLAPFTTFGVGGPARFFTQADTEADVRETLDFAHSKNLPLFVLGSGSNLVVSDAGFLGVVVRIAIKGIDESDAGSKRLFQAGAGRREGGAFERHRLSPPQPLSGAQRLALVSRRLRRLAPSL